MYKQRIKKLKELLKKDGLDAVFISGMKSTVPNIFYFTGFLDVFPSSFIVTAGREWLLTFSPRKARIKTTVENIVDLNTTKISDFLKGAGLEGGLLGVDGNESFSFFEGLKTKMPKARFADISSGLEMLRAVKDETEIYKTKIACLNTDSIMEDLRAIDLTGKNEEQTANIIKKAIIEKGKEWAFDTIVAGDANSSFVHHVPEKTKFREIVLMDFGVKNEHYCADMTRMITINRKKEHIDSLGALKHVQGLLEDYVKPGVPACEIHNFAKDELDKLGFRESNFGNFHSLGHSVGLEAHDGFSLSPKNETPVLENMVLTLEPALYFQGAFGVRLEDTVVVTKNGIKRLTKSRYD